MIIYYVVCIEESGPKIEGAEGLITSTPAAAHVFQEWAGVKEFLATKTRSTFSIRPFSNLEDAQIYVRTLGYQKCASTVVGEENIATATLAAPCEGSMNMSAGWMHSQLDNMCAGINLDALQYNALEEVLLRRRNVFLSGSGGVGKSFVTNLIINLLRRHHGRAFSRKVCITASTGIASTHVDGTTLHAATGVGVPRCWDHFGRMFYQDKVVERRWSRHYEVLFVDEISMLSGEMLDTLNRIIQKLRRSKEPFGGLQVVFVGDFAQLPPVPEDPSYTTSDFVRRQDWAFEGHEDFWHMPVISRGALLCDAETQGPGLERGRVAPRRGARQEVLFSNRGLAFQSDAWWDLDMRVIELKKVFRQDDARFIATLNRVRTGHTTAEDFDWLNQEFYHAPLRREQALQESERKSRERPQLKDEGGREEESDQKKRKLAWKTEGEDGHGVSASGGGPASTSLGEAAQASLRQLGSLEMTRPAPACQIAEEPLHLYPVNALVERRNRVMLDRLPTRLEEYEAQDFVWHEDSGVILRRQETAQGYDGRQRRDLELLLGNHLYYKTCLAAERVKLKLGAKILLLKNVDLLGPQKLVNGSVGMVVEWAPEGNPFFDQDTSGVGAGAAGGESEENLREPSPAPHAVETRPPSSENGTDNKRSLHCYKERLVEAWYTANKSRIPVVLFSNGRKKAIFPELFSETIVGVGCTCRLQLPLMIGFAISIHKSQGMTLQEALVDVERCFDGGQTYVALSRVGPRAGLRLAQRLSYSNVKVNPTFLLWHNLHKTMVTRRREVLAMLEAEGDSGAVTHAEGLGLKGLHQEAVAVLMDSTKRAETPVALKRAWASLKKTLDQLKPGKNLQRQDVDILHWQMLDWWRPGNARTMEAIYNVRHSL